MGMFESLFSICALALKFFDVLEPGAADSGENKKLVPYLFAGISLKFFVNCGDGYMVVGKLKSFQRFGRLKHCVEERLDDGACEHYPCRGYTAGRR